jgi:hypothetical protein
MPAPQNLYQFHFKPGENVVDLDRFERFLPRIPNERDAHYAGRLRTAGLAFVTDSNSIHDDFLSYKALQAAAEDAGQAVVVLTNPIPNPMAERLAERETKSPQEYLDEIRAQAHTTGEN